MNIETPTIKSTKQTETSNSTGTTNNTIKGEKSFKEQLSSVKSETKTNGTEENKKVQAVGINEANNELNNIASNNPNIQQTAIEKNLKNTSEEKEKNILTKDKTTTNSIVKTLQVSDPINELASQIATLNEVKNNPIVKPQKGDLKLEISDKDDLKTIKMDNKDITFFVNLVENQHMSAQSAQANNISTIKDNSFTEIKSEATKQTVQVSTTLMDAINESAKTNKPFRIDFDDNIAVIMKVDKNGAISANFIPGDAAVENYLRNNIASLRQSFDEQNIPYNNLSYSNQHKQQQQQKQNKNKENDDV